MSHKPRNKKNRPKRNEPIRTHQDPDGVARQRLPVAAGVVGSCSARLEELPDAGVVGAGALHVVAVSVAQQFEGFPGGAEAVQLPGAGGLQ